MSHPKTNDIVSITYIGKLDTGEVFATVDEKKPLLLTIGNSDLPPTLEQAICEMTTGETRKIRVSPDEGFGPRQKDLMQTIESQEIIDSLKPKPGMVMSLKIQKDGEDQKVPATVIEVSGSTITIDYNHPLAGHHLTYDVTLIDIQKAQ